MEGQVPLISVKNLHVYFDGLHPFIAVDHISFQVDSGETLAVVGESGSGKSLTALALMGLLPNGANVNGEIILNNAGKATRLDNIITNKEWRELRGSEIGMVFQEPMSSLNPVMKIGKQITESIIAHQQLSMQEAKQAAIEWLGKVKLPEPGKIYERYPHQLSGGQKQRVMIAMAMCNNPLLLIADEPTTALDVTVQQEIINLMQELQREHGTAMMFITHDLALAASIADKILVMYQGKVMEYGDTKKLLHNPENPYTKALMASKPSADQKGKRLPTVADFMEGSGDKVNASGQASLAIGDERILQVKDLRVWFTEQRSLFGRPITYFKAVDGVSFDLKKGEVLGLVGESGCGKSTLSRSLIGLLPVHSGQVLFNNEDIATFKPKEWRQVRRQIQMIFQDPYSSLNPRMTVGDMLMEPMRAHNIVPDRELKKEVRRLLELVRLPIETMKRYPHQFSGGQRQRLGIARALALRPQLLICDESVSALDVSVQAQILNLLKDLQAEFQLTYLFISHDLSVVHYMSDRVMVMQAGKIVESGIAEQVMKYPQDNYTKKLIGAMPEMKN